jgi:nucleotide-binding universal stress UspA family protein
MGPRSAATHLSSRWVPPPPRAAGKLWVPSVSLHRGQACTTRYWWPSTGARTDRATEHALALAERFDAALHALYVVDTRRYGEPGLSSTELVVDDLEDYGHELVTTVADRAGDRGIEVVTACRHGRPDETIHEYADEVEADAVVVGYRGHGHGDRDHVGSVTERVVRRGRRPVLVA